jgi:sterol desaturase/sphingolipid hydroxylase (fatty acid hydroxylase superfamily)
MHRVHHSDLDCDVTTGLRFHPFEIVISMLIKFVTIIAIGPPVVAVIVFEVVLNAASMFTHSNIRIHKKLDCFIRLFFVTPDMHRIHHSMNENETNSNFGFFISIWDRIFGTYRNRPALGYKNMEIGLKQFSQPKWQNFRWLIMLPFVGKISGYAINQRNYSDKE